MHLLLAEHTLAGLAGCPEHDDLAPDNFDLPPGAERALDKGEPSTRIEHVFETIRAAIAATDCESLDRSQAQAALTGLSELRSAVEALEVRVASRLDVLADQDGGADARGSLLADGRRSKNAARKMADRADALAELPSVAASFADGAVTGEQVDALARAARATSPEAVEASDLLDTAVNTNVNLTNSAVAEWTKKQRSAEERQKRHLRNRRDRNATCRVRDEDGAWTMFLQGDQETGARIQAALDAETDRLWREDGGRDGTPEEIRTNAQRRYDAALNLFCESRPDSSDFTPIRNQVLWGVTDPGDAHIGGCCNEQPVHGSAAGSTGSEPSTRSRAPTPSHTPMPSETPRPPRPPVVDLRTGNVLPATVLGRLLCDAEITGMLFDTAGDILWSGRKHRTAPPKLCRALIKRDKGCVHCAAPPGQCEVHHLIEWEHGGTTDPDNCVLLCTRCHHDVHDRGLTLDNPTMNRLWARISETTQERKRPVQPPSSTTLRPVARSA